VSALVGTASFSHAGWRGVFYSRTARPSDYLAEYSSKFQTVELDTTFYATPSRRTVEGWRKKTPPGFVFAAKVPRLVTHEKLLAGCEEEMARFLETMQLLGDRLGPLLLQFPYFNRKVFSSLDPFLDILDPFLGGLPQNLSFAVEVRNRRWIQPTLVECLKRHQVALVFIDHPWMGPPSEWEARAGLATAGFSYVRLLGDRRGIERITTSFDRVVQDRSEELREWAALINRIAAAGVKPHVYVNNHYSGHAPETVRSLAAILS